MSHNFMKIKLVIVRKYFKEEQSYFIFTIFNNYHIMKEGYLLSVPVCWYT